MMNSKTQRVFAASADLNISLSGNSYNEALISIGEGKQLVSLTPVSGVVRTTGSPIKIINQSGSKEVGEDFNKDEKNIKGY